MGTKKDSITNSKQGTNAKQRGGYSRKNLADKNMIKENVSKIIQAECEKTPQKILLVDLGVSKTTLGAYKKTVTLPSLDIVYNLHKKYGYSYEVLIEGKEIENDAQMFYVRYKNLPTDAQRCIDYIMKLSEQVHD